jgi:2'-5' RNA ligase
LAYGIITELSERQNPRVFQTWSALKVSCGLSPESLSPFPHLTWLVADDFDLPALKAALMEFAAGRRLYPAQASGLGLFTGDQPVVYIPVLKTPRLSNTHRHLWGKVFPLACNPSTLYAPPAWTPHITLAYGNLRPDDLACAVQRLAYQPIHLEFKIDHIALGYWDDQDHSIINERFNFIAAA